MTQHALDRLAERLPRCDPAEVLNIIVHQVQNGGLEHVVDDVTGNAVYQFDYRDGRTIFPVVAPGSVVVTVLALGMSVTTSTGRHILAHDPLGPGVYDIPADRYHADPCAAPSMSNSIGKLLLDRSPLHAWTASPLLNPNWEPKNTTAFDVGRAAHGVILGKGEGYAVCPPQYLASNGAMSTKAAKEWIADTRAAGLTPLKQDQADAIEAMADVMRTALVQLGLVIDPEHSEKVAIAEIDGVMNRCMIDNVPVKEIPGIGLVHIDFKTCESATDAACRRAMAAYGYDFQDEHYTQVWKRATGEKRTMVFLFQEKTAPFEVNALISMREPGHSADWGQTAADKVTEARRMWGHCLKTNNWPGYPRLISAVGAPPWHAADWEQRQDTKATAEALLAARKFQEPERMTS